MVFLVNYMGKDSFGTIYIAFRGPGTNSKNPGLLRRFRDSWSLWQPLLLILGTTELSNSFRQFVSSGTRNKFRNSWGAVETLFNKRLQVGKKEIVCQIWWLYRYIQFWHRGAEKLEVQKFYKQYSKGLEMGCTFSTSQHHWSTAEYVMKVHQNIPRGRNIEGQSYLFGVQQSYHLHGRYNNGVCFPVSYVHPPHFMLLLVGNK